MEHYTARLKELERLFSNVDSGSNPAGDASMEATLRAVEELVRNLQDDAEELTGETTDMLLLDLSIYHF